LLKRMELIENAEHRRFFRVILGGVLTEASNVRISGKGRRYRSNWKVSELSARAVFTLFSDKAQQAIVEAHKFSLRPQQRFEVVRGDCRETLGSKEQFDLVVFSPPYPNSFDYTDVYNVELWVLGYLNSFEANRTLRKATLSSHVQVSRKFAAAPRGSRTLNRTLKALNGSLDLLWSKHLPAMIGGYFADLIDLLGKIYPTLAVGGSVWMCVGDSQYNSIRIPTARILRELAVGSGFSLTLTEPIRSMRSSPQQGGRAELPETLLVLTKT